MIKKIILSTMVACVLLGSAPQTADAKIFEVWGSALAGGGWGKGKSGRDFYQWAGGGAIGGEVGLKILFLSAFVDYLRFYGGNVGANQVGINLGGDWTIGLGAVDLVIRASGGFYWGTLPDNATNLISGASVNSDNVNTRGVGFRGGLGLRYPFAKIFAIGVTPMMGYHYFFAGANEDITDTDNNSSGWDFHVLGYLRVGLGF